MNILSEAPATPNKKANDRCGVATSRLKTTALLSLCDLSTHESFRTSSLWNARTQQFQKQRPVSYIH